MKRGAFYNLVARGAFIAGSYPIHVLLGRWLGPDLYGVFGVALSVLMVGMLFLNNGVRQSVARIVAREPGRAIDALRAGLRAQWGVSRVAAVVLVIAAWPLSSVLQDSRLLWPLVLCAVVLVTHGFIFVFAGALNGLGWFGSEALLVGGYGVLRPVLVLSLAAVGFGVAGAFVGMLLTSVATVTLGLILTRGLSTSRGLHPIEHSRIHSVAVPTMFAFGGLTLLQYCDLFVIKALGDQLPPATPGVYAAAGAFAKLPFWAFFTLGGVSLPVATRLAHGQNWKQLRHLAGSMTLLCCGSSAAAVFLVHWLGASLIELTYGGSYVGGAAVLPLLMTGMACVGLASVFAHLEIALNDVKWLAIASGILTLTDAVAVWVGTRWSGMIGAALATTASSATLCLILGFRVAWLLARYANMPPTATDPGGNLLEGSVEAIRGSHAAIEPATATPL